MDVVDKEHPATLSLPGQLAPGTLSGTRGEAGRARLGSHTIALLVYHRDGTQIVALKPGAGVVIGRAAPADVVLADATLSRAHARFELRDDGVSVEDLGSHNGTLVRGERIHTALVAPGEDIELGQLWVRVQRIAYGGVLGLDSHDAFRTALEREMVRARFFAEPLAVMFVRALGGAHIGKFASRVQRLLRPVDRAAAYSSDTLEMLLPKVGSTEASALAKAVAADRGDPPLACAAAAFPEVATSAEELLALCHSALPALSTATPVHIVGSRVTRIAAAPLSDRPIASCAAMKQLYETVERLAQAVIPVLLVGETGSGKEVVAQALHRQGPRAARPLGCVNCGAIPAQLVESTLFGHERGAFTGASQRAKGVFESADGGSVLLDEIAELPAPAQAALLRVLETKRLTRVGASEEIEVDVRVIAATHRDLDEMVRSGSFRRDLLYRLNAMVVWVPPLRERIEELPALIDRFVREANEANRRSIAGLTPDTLAILARYDWPGNVRELKNTIERAVVIARGDIISEDDLPEAVRRQRRDLPATMPASPASGAAAPAGDWLDLKTHLQRCEADYLLSALSAVQWDQSKAARLIDVPRRTFIHKLKQYGIKRLGYALDGDDEDHR